MVKLKSKNIKNRQLYLFHLFLFPFIFKFHRIRKTKIFKNDYFNGIQKLLGDANKQEYQMKTNASRKKKKEKLTEIRRKNKISKK